MKISVENYIILQWYIYRNRVELAVQNTLVNSAYDKLQAYNIVGLRKRIA